LPLRFTDTEKWKKAWFRKLPPIYKLFWDYLCDMCDHAGMWDVDLERAEFEIGGKIAIDDINKYFGDQIRVIKEDKWFFEPFIPFQYKHEIEDLNPESNVHLGVIKVLKRYNLYLNGSGKSLTNPCLTLNEWLTNLSEPLPNPCPTLKEPLPNPSLTLMDMDKDKNKEKLETSNINNNNTSINNIKSKKFKKPTIEEIEEYAEKIKYNLDPEQFFEFYEQKDWMVGKNKMKNWKAAINNWKAHGWGIREGPPAKENKPVTLIKKFDEFCSLCPELSREEALNSIDLTSDDKVLLKDALNKRAMPIPGG